MDTYTRATMRRDVQYQVFAKERTLLLQREDQLQQVLGDVVELSQVLQEQYDQRAEVIDQNQGKQLEELEEQNSSLIEQLELEKKIHEQELANVAKSYQEKLSALKDQGAVNELQLRAAHDEGLLSDQLLRDVRD